MLAIWEQLNFQNSSSFLMSELYYLMDYLNYFIFFIMLFTGYFMLIFSMNKKNFYFNSENHLVELIWTLIPGIILIFIAIPSLNLLYCSEEVYKPILSLKTIGHQWYWTYEYSNFKNLEFDSFMLPYSSNSQFRLLDVDNRLNLPFFSPVQMFVTSSDVLHSWTIPSLGFKADANPGRLNVLYFVVNKMGSYFGQCSELCGTNHSFMPINMVTTNMNNFKNWIMNFFLDSLKHKIFTFTMHF
uniref:Cytochrome c oxidase subunit 2 n=1 Tax=Echiniscus testudo TaxID=399800 RepID=A0A348BR54_ECHTS|nr:cytochrome c oxidase subunit 2 [Echiniscus testudo]